MSIPPNSFSEFLSFFPKATLPLTIQHSDHHHFSKSNDPLTEALLQTYVIPNLDFEIDEFTEFLPCLKFESTPGMYHLVLWSARLMHYSFYVMNFNQQGMFLDLADVAGFYTDENKIIQKMAHIDAEGNLFLVEGNLDEIQHEVNPDKTKKWQLKILPDGLFQTTAIKL